MKFIYLLFVLILIGNCPYSTAGTDENIDSDNKQEGAQVVEGSEKSPTTDELPATTSVPETPVAAIPGNEIMLFEIKTNRSGKIKLSKGKNISNHKGYDSQPKFSADGELIYYTREVKSEGNSQMDIYQYDLKTGKSEPYMSTPESEYSATLGYDKPGLSVVQVDAKGDQYIVILNNEAPAGEQVKRYSDLKQVGYFNWTGGHKLWSFVLNEEGGGDLYHMGHSKKPFFLMKNVGRTFVNDVTNKLVYFVDKNTTPWRILSRERKRHESIEIMSLPEGVEDFTVDSLGRFWAGKDNTLYINTDRKTWRKVKKFKFRKLHQISRLTTNPAADQIAIVFAEKSNKE